MVLHCIARVNQSRVAGVCPQIVLYCTKQRSVEPERALFNNHRNKSMVGGN